MGEAFKGVDPTETDVGLFASELFNRPEEPIGYLAFSRELKLPQSDIHPEACTGECQQSDGSLNQRCSDLVLQLPLLLFERYALLSRKTSQVSGAQRRMKKRRKDQEGHQDYCDPGEGGRPDDLDGARAIGQRVQEVGGHAS